MSCKNIGSKFKNKKAQTFEPSGRAQLLSSEKQRLDLGCRRCNVNINLGEKNLQILIQCVSKKSIHLYYHTIIVSCILVYGRIQNTISTVVAVWIITIINTFLISFTVLLFL